MNSKKCGALWWVVCLVLLFLLNGCTFTPAEQTQPSGPSESLTPASTQETSEETHAPIQLPTEEPTQAPTQVPTEEPTQAPTQAPTEEPTQAPTQAPTEEPTQAPTQAPTEEPTQAPTQAPTESTVATGPIKLPQIPG